MQNSQFTSLPGFVIVSNSTVQFNNVTFSQGNTNGPGKQIVACLLPQFRMQSLLHVRYLTASGRAQSTWTLPAECMQTCTCITASLGCHTRLWLMTHPSLQQSTRCGACKLATDSCTAHHVRTLVAAVLQVREVTSLVASLTSCAVEALPEQAVEHQASISRRSRQACLVR